MTVTKLISKISHHVNGEHRLCTVGCVSVWSGVMCKVCRCTWSDGEREQYPACGTSLHTPEMSSESARVVSCIMAGMDTNVARRIASEGFFGVVLVDGTLMQCHRCGYTVDRIGYDSSKHDCRSTDYSQICRTKMFVLTKRITIDRILCTADPQPAHPLGRDGERCRQELCQVCGPYVKVVKVHECVVCLEREPRVLFTSCGHKVTCRSCSVRLTHCPMCRRNVSKCVVVS
ncbi:25.7 Inhibitor of apoptosis/RING/U box [Spodoptera frugiperda ascovirus 1a]|uniref:25.7 Inhibitor of apoptosis/RING/U box n=1 Tax=Spodoptera frugiperda ascovirus 1a TaxID=113370 RepID=Q0E576_SFAVA|nr:25.7 Inhibitor of apoptosis/RING/U box [Spodoptera frugiperda ascovirus 1a]CAL44625.1 25.7 Inhibitor of apoptosis/RING/U box [Spodoptera frugiperda ascovirus 1a]